MAAVNTRRLPNAMNFLRQLEILKKTGDTDSFEVPCNICLQHLLLWLSIFNVQAASQGYHSLLDCFMIKLEAALGLFEFHDQA